MPNDRYTRQELVIGKANQKKLEKARVAIVGLGALGTVAAELLTRAGIKQLTLMDRDVVEESNLQRQTLYAEKDVNKPKVECAKKRLKEINKKVNITTHFSDLNYKNIALLKNHNLILDCTDNMYTRFLIDEYSYKKNIPFVYAGVIKDIGRVMGITKSTPRFSCLFKETKGLPTCDTAGVLGTASMIIAALQVQEGINILTDNYKEQRLITLNLKNMQLTTLKTKKNKNNLLFKNKFPFLEGKKETKGLAYNCSGVFSYTLKEINFTQLKQRLKKSQEKEKITVTQSCILHKKFSLFKNGKMLIRAKSQKEAKGILAKYVGM